MIDEAGAEQLLLADLAENRRERFDELLRAALARAQERFDRFGFPAPRSRGKPDDEQLTVDIDGPHMVVTANFYDAIDLRPMRRWADSRTRRLVYRAVLKMGRSFWCCMPSHWLYQNAYVYGELLPVVQIAIRTRKPSGEAIWKEALNAAASAGLSEDETGMADHIHGIGDRKDFERWLSMQVSIDRAHTAFQNAPPTDRIDRRRSAAVRHWARRVLKLCADWGDLHKFDLVVDQNDMRDMHERSVVLCGGKEESAIHWYFDVTNDGNGENPGCVISLNHETGGGLIEGLQFAIASDCVFADLRRAMR